jgi:hypothetical protein
VREGEAAWAGVVVVDVDPLIGLAAELAQHEPAERLRRRST